MIRVKKFICDACKRISTRHRIAAYLRWYGTEKCSDWKSDELLKRLADDIEAGRV